MADTRIGGVYATFRAKNDPWLRASRQNVNALKRQSQATKKLRRDASALRGTVRNLIGSLGLLAGGAGISALARKTFEAGRNLSKLGSALVENSNRFGITAAQIQLLGRAFEGGGASQEDFLKGFRNFNRNLIDAQAGMESFRRTFRLVGISVDDAAAQGLSAYDVFLQLSDGLLKVENQAVRVNVAQTLLGRAGTALLFELQRGSKGLLEQAESFRILGIITDEQAARLKVLDQSYTNTSNVIRTAQARIVADNAALFVSFNNFIATSIPAAFKVFIKTIDAVRRNFALISRAVTIFIGVLLVGPVLSFVAAIGRVTAAILTLRLAVIATTVAFRLLLRVFLVGFLIEGIFITIDAVNALKQSFGSLGDFAAVVAIKYLDAFSNIIDNINSLRDSIENFFDSTEIVFTFPVDLASSFYSPERQAELREVARRGGETFSDIFLGLVRERYANFLQGGGALPSLPPPVDVPFAPGVRPSAQSQDLTRRANEALSARIPITVTLTRALEDRIRLGKEELALLEIGAGVTDRRRIQAETISQFETARINLLRQREDIESRLGHLQTTLAATQLSGLSTISAELEKQIISEKKKLDLIISQTTANAALRAEFEKQAAGYATILEGIGKQTEAINSLQQVYDNALDSIGQFAASAILNFKDIESAARSLAETILNDLIKALVIAPIRSAAQGFLGSLAGSGLQHGGLGSGLSLVGEGGPELVDFRRPGRVYTNEQLGAALTGSGGAPVFNFSPIIQSSDGPAVRRAVLESFPIFEERVRRQFASDMSRPSALRSATRR